METLFIGKNIIFLPEIHSTNSYAINLLKNVNLPEGTVVHTANQTSGKGQRGSSWVSDPGLNLTASVILRPGFLDIKNQFFLYQMVALACYDAMAEIIDTRQIDIKIKWPNDILVNQHKIAGILIENNIQNNMMNWCVAGIGININQTIFAESFSATSLKLLTGKEFEVDQILRSLCIHLEKYYLAAFNNKLPFLKDQYLQHLYGINEYKDFEMNGQSKSMLVKGLGETGLLLLEDEKGNTSEVDVKQVRWIY